MTRSEDSRTSPVGSRLGRMPPSLKGSLQRAGGNSMSLEEGTPDRRATCAALENHGLQGCEYPFPRARLDRRLANLRRTRVLTPVPRLTEPTGPRATLPKETQERGCMMEHRRRRLRLHAGWCGICHIEGDSVLGGRDCRVSDMSTFGLRITLHHFWPSELVGRHVSVETPGVGHSVNVRLEGVITTAEPAPRACVRVGIKFDSLSQSEITIAALLGTMVDGNVNESGPTLRAAPKILRQPRNPESVTRSFN